MKVLQATILLVVSALAVGSSALLQADMIDYAEDFESAQAVTDWGSTYVVDDGSGSNHVLRAGATQNWDIPSVDASEGVVRVSVDLLAHGLDGSEWRYVYFGNSTSFADSNAYFGLRMSGSSAKFTWKDGDGTGGTITDYYSTSDAANDAWYTFLADVYLTGPKANTWDVQIFDASGTSIASATNLGFRTDGAAIDHLGYSFSGGAGDFIQVDNLSIRTIPEPATLALMVFGGLCLAMAMRRRHWHIG